MNTYNNLVLNAFKPFYGRAINLQTLFIVTVFFQEYLIEDSRPLSAIEKVIATIYAAYFTIGLLLLIPYVWAMFRQARIALSYPESMAKPSWMQEATFQHWLNVLFIDAGMITACVLSQRHYLLVTYLIVTTTIRLTRLLALRRYRQGKKLLRELEEDHGITHINENQ